jgi:hypothetical protein
MIQVAICFVKNTPDANEKLRLFQKENPQRKILNVSVSSTDPFGFFMTITYEIKV